MTTTLAPVDTTVAGYANYRLAGFWLWLDNERSLAAQEESFFKFPTLSVKRGLTWTPAFWGKLYNFYTSACLRYEREFITDAEDKLTLGDKSTFLRESVARYEFYKQELRQAAEQERLRTYQPAPFPLPAEPIQTAERPFWHTPYRDFIHPAVLVGPSPNLVATPDLLAGVAILVVLHRKAG
jgi:hypothetical protein